MTSTEHLPVVFLMGATATGKTALSVSIARQINAEIISVDSALVYRGMNIGTAKPALDERAGIRHHLIDICDIWDTYSAARFVKDAQYAIADIQSRGKRVLLVGGTMLYFKALDEGLALLPDADEGIRESLVRDATAKGWPALHRELERIDPQAALRIHPNDPQRLQRALEVYRITGKPMSELQADTHSQLAMPPLKFALAPQNRQWLHLRIEQRFHSMLASGFMDEMRLLRSDRRINCNLSAMRSVGYRQAWEHLDSESDPTAGEKDEWVGKAVAATRQLAKRQLTWLRGMKNVTILACDTMSLSEQQQAIVEAVQDAAQRHSQEQQ